MDELKLLIEMVSNLPTLAVWVLVGYLVYKVAVIGSIYGLARFAIDKTHSWLMLRAKPDVDVVMLLDGKTFDTASSREALIRELDRLRFIGAPGEYKQSTNIYEQYGVKLLRQAIDKMEADAKVK